MSENDLKVNVGPPTHLNTWAAKEHISSPRRLMFSRSLSLCVCVSVFAYAFTVFVCQCMHAYEWEHHRLDYGWGQHCQVEELKSRGSPVFFLRAAFSFFLFFAILSYAGPECYLTFLEKVEKPPQFTSIVKTSPSLRLSNGTVKRKAFTLEFWVSTASTSCTVILISCMAIK